MARTKLRTALIVAAVVAAGVAMSFGRELYNNYQVDAEISRLKAKTASLEAERLSISRLKDELVSEDFLEGEARLKLGLKKPGEAAIIIPESERRFVRVTGVEPQPEETVGSLRLWWSYFFHE